MDNKQDHSTPSSTPSVQQSAAASSSTSQPSSSSSNPSSSSSSSTPSSSSSSTTARQRSSRRTISVNIVPTLGVPFSLSCPQTLTIDKFKEDVSDRVGISSKKIALLFRSSELRTGSLVENGLSDGSEVRLVPSLESGVNTTSSSDPLAMMKHSMIGISDQQIDDFLAGKVPLSVAIRLGESVVVVNLNRAKVEDVEMEPPHEKRHASHGTRSGSSRSSSREKHNSSLNTNPHWSSSAACTTSTSSVTTPPCSVPVRSVIPAGTPIPSADVGSPSPHLGRGNNTIDEHLWSSSLPTNRRRPREDTDSSSSSSSPSIPTGTIPAHIPAPPTSSSTISTSLPPSPLIDNPSTTSLRTIKKARRSSTSKNGSGSHRSSSKLQLYHQNEWDEFKRLREATPSNNGISMKRKAVMEAIGEILKKMYSQRSKGKSPGTFKGRFSSEFTCDNDMQEIIHSRTTMTSYGGGASPREPHSSRRSRGGHSSVANGGSHLTKAKYEENETTRNKVELLKRKIHQQKLLKRQKRERSDNSTGAMGESTSQEILKGDVDVDLKAPPTKIRKKSTFGGMKGGFLLSD